MHQFFLLIIFMFFSIIGFAQVEKYKYVHLKKIYPDFSFTSNRTYLSDSIFIDSGLLCSSNADECSIKFKKIKTEWYVEADGEWQEFFSLKDSLIKVVYFKSMKTLIYPLPDNMIYNGTQLYGFDYRHLYVNSSESNILWFDPTFGIVLFGQNPEYSLIREDFNKAKKSK